MFTSFLVKSQQHEKVFATWSDHFFVKEKFDRSEHLLETDEFNFSISKRFEQNFDVKYVIEKLDKQYNLIAQKAIQSSVKGNKGSVEAILPFHSGILVFKSVYDESLELYSLKMQLLDPVSMRYAKEAIPIGQFKLNKMIRYSNKRFAISKLDKQHISIVWFGGTVKQPEYKGLILDDRLAPKPINISVKPNSSKAFVPLDFQLISENEVLVHVLDKQVKEALIWKKSEEKEVILPLNYEGVFVQQPVKKKVADRVYVLGLYSIKHREKEVAASGLHFSYCSVKDSTDKLILNINLVDKIKEKKSILGSKRFFKRALDKHNELIGYTLVKADYIEEKFHLIAQHPRKPFEFLYCKLSHEGDLLDYFFYAGTPVLNPDLSKGLGLIKENWNGDNLSFIVQEAGKNTKVLQPYLLNINEQHQVSKEQLYSTAETDYVLLHEGVLKWNQQELLLKTSNGNNRKYLRVYLKK